MGGWVRCVACQADPPSPLVPRVLSRALFMDATPPQLAYRTAGSPLSLTDMWPTYSLPLFLGTMRVRIGRNRDSEDNPLCGLLYGEEQPEPAVLGNTSNSTKSRGVKCHPLFLQPFPGLLRPLRLSRLSRLLKVIGVVMQIRAAPIEGALRIMLLGIVCIAIAGVSWGTATSTSF